MSSLPAEDPMRPLAPGSHTVRLYRSPLLIMLVLAYSTNYMDRTIVGTLAQAIKTDLRISDGQLGLLQGFAFVMLYAFMGVPIARLAERRDRVTIISVCMALWAGLTMLCGAAQNFAQLLVMRICVGLGEAGCNAPSHSMVADEFEDKYRSRAIGIYNLGVPIGTMIGAITAGLVAQRAGWRMAFVIVGAPGLVLAIIMRLTIKEPPRRAPVSQSSSPGGVTARAMGWRLVTDPALRNLLLGFSLTTFASAALSAFTQPYFIRTFHLSYAEIGVIFGLSTGAVVAASLIFSGKLADLFVPRDVRWHAWLPALGVAISLPFSILSFLSPSWPLALVTWMVGILFMNWYIAPTQSAIHNIVGTRSVAMAMALVLLFQNLVGLGGGPLAAGVTIDALTGHFAPRGFDFARSCPGGIGHSNAGLTCAAVLVQATRWGMILSQLIKIWAVIHFLLAARHLQKALGGPTKFA